MGLPEIYEKLFGKEAAAVKKADEVAEVKAEEVAEVKAEEQTELTEEQVDKALSEMSETELAALAKEVADDTKESAKKEEAAHQKEAEELFAAGRIFGQGFLAETNGKKTAAAATPEPSKAMAKFSALLEKELGKK